MFKTVWILVDNLTKTGRNNCWDYCLDCSISFSDLSTIMRRLSESFVSLASELYQVHEQIKVYNDYITFFTIPYFLIINFLCPSFVFNANKFLFNVDWFNVYQENALFEIIYIFLKKSLSISIIGNEKCNVEIFLHIEYYFYPQAFYFTFIHLRNIKFSKFRVLFFFYVEI